MRESRSLSEGPLLPEVWNNPCTLELVEGLTLESLILRCDESLIYIYNMDCFCLFCISCLKKQINL
ncbi:hypothetical protein LguiA_014500 [Lonicera macranthoides]